MKRFYKEVSVVEAQDGWQVMLDARGIRSQGGAQQVVPSRMLAELLAAEWEAQGEEIDPKSFVYRDLADLALDVIRADREAAISALLQYAQTDTLCYRADPEDALHARQQEIWEPLVAACETREGLRLARVSGIVHKPQADKTMAALGERLERLDDFTLAGLHTLTSLAASLVVGLAALEAEADAASLFAAANAEEDWQAEQWGWDAEAETTRATKLQAFEMAHAFVQAARG